MKVKLNQDQGYVSLNEGNKFGKKDEIVDIDPLFYKLISTKCTPVKADEENKSKEEEKPLAKMNKEELIAKAKSLNVDLDDAAYEAMTKADILKVVVDAQNAAEKKA